MHRVLAVGAAALALVVAAPATAATPAERRIAKLELQTARLTKQVATLQKEVKLLTGAIVVNFAADACAVAGTADALMWTWSAIDKVGAIQATPTTYFGPQPAIDDRMSCSDLSLVRQAPQTPPTLSSFISMIDFLWGP